MFMLFSIDIFMALDIFVIYFRKKTKRDVFIHLRSPTNTHKSYNGRVKLYCIENQFSGFNAHSSQLYEL